MQLTGVPSRGRIKILSRNLVKLQPDEPIGPNAECNTMHKSLLSVVNRKMLKKLVK